MCGIRSETSSDSFSPFYMLIFFYLWAKFNEVFRNPFVALPHIECFDWMDFVFYRQGVSSLESFLHIKFVKTFCFVFSRPVICSGVTVWREQSQTTVPLEAGPPNPSQDHTQIRGFGGKESAMLDRTLNSLRQLPLLPLKEHL